MARKMLIIVFVAACTCGFDAQGQVTTDGGRHFLVAPVSIAAPAEEEDLVAQPPELKMPILLNFDRFPGPPWQPWDCGVPANNTIFQGILTLNSPTCDEIDLKDPDTPWNKYVRYDRGWMIETSLQVDPRTPPLGCANTNNAQVQIWAADYKSLTVLGFDTTEVCITYPEKVVFPVDGTNFHVYRLEKKANRARIYVDGVLVIDHTFSVNGGGTQALSFGDMNGHVHTLSRWDYFSYDVFPQLTW